MKWQALRPAKVRLAALDIHAARFISARRAPQKKRPPRTRAEINRLQDVLYAEGKRALLVILQGIDTAGKDGTIRDVFNATGPLGVRATAFRKPSEEELSHDFLWRVHAAVPARGTIGIFNRSHYEDVLVVKVRQLVPPDEIERRYEQINAFEKHLSENGTKILKFLLHYLEGRTARAAARAAGKSDQAVEVQSRRPRGPQSMGRVRGSL